MTNECRFSPTSRTRILTQWQCRHVLPADPTDFPHSFRPQASLSSALPLYPANSYLNYYSFLVNTQAALVSLHCEVLIISDVLH